MYFMFIQYYIGMASNEHFDRIKHNKSLLPMINITNEGLKS